MSVKSFSGVKDSLMLSFIPENDFTDCVVSWGDAADHAVGERRTARRRILTAETE